MTNITLSIEESVYRRMRRHSDIRWSEFVRKAIKRRLDQLETLDHHPENESILAMLASEDILKKEWENEPDERWNDV